MLNRGYRMKSSGRTFVACVLGLSSATAAAFARREGVPALTLAVPNPVMFNRDIGFIFFWYCVFCYHPGEAGLFPLLSFLDAKAYARQIAAVTSTRFMPPW